MSKRGVNIHKRQDGRWEGRYKIGVRPNGTTKYSSVYGTSYTEVKEKLISAMAEKVIVQPHTKERHFSEVLQLWLNNNRLKQKGSTEHKYRTIIERHIDPALGAKKLSQITSVVINTFLEQKLKTGRLDHKGGLSPSYVRTMSLIIQSAMQFAVDEEFCQPLKSPICKPIAKKKDLDIFSREEQARLELFLLQQTDTSCLGILISLYTGLRIGEMCALTWEDIDLSAGVIHIRHTIARVRNADPDRSSGTVLILDTPKTGSAVRDIPISSVLLERLTEIKQVSSCGFVLSDSLTFISPRTYEYRFHKLLGECGVKQVNYHALRHTFATRCIESGVDVKSLSEILGHANVGITLNTYVHSSLDIKRMQLEKLHSKS